MAIFGEFLDSAFPAGRVQHISDLHLNSHWDHIMCQSLVDIHSATAEIRRGKKIEEDRKKPQGKNIMACPIP